MGLLLPALAQAITAQESGQTQHEALSSVMPPLLKVCFLLCASTPCLLTCMGYLCGWVHVGGACVYESSVSAHHHT